MHTILEGFFAVEQYVPDYVTSLMHVIRKSHGRSHFHLRWGSEEEKHADMWRNAVLFGGKRSLEWMEEYMADLRSNEWRIPWDDPLHMVFYTVFQERATQVNYLNLGLVAKGLHTNPAFADDADPVAGEDVPDDRGGRGGALQLLPGVRAADAVLLPRGVHAGDGGRAAPLRDARRRDHPGLRPVSRRCCTRTASSARASMRRTW